MKPALLTLAALLAGGLALVVALLWWAATRDIPTEESTLDEKQ